MQIESSSSRLNTFKESKKEINKIFANIFDYINDCNGFLCSIHKSDAKFQALINAGEVKSLSSLVEKVKGIQSVISRDNMKCVFFGRTSNGKSTTINAMLGDRILPAGMGHTTSCFLEIRGTKESQGSVSIRSSPKPGSDLPHIERKQIDSVQELARAVSTTKLPTDSLIRIDWPSQKCALLSEDVVILDSPGIDVDPNIDQCIDKHCLDADVFVLVVSSVATLTETEKAFFHKLSESFSNPDIFILNNHWDKSAKQTDFANEIRHQHLERCIHFLTKELQVCSKTEAKNRVFFVSAKEVLSMHSKNKSESDVLTTLDSPGSKPLREGWQSRLAEFRAFEGILGKTLSESATKTKFAAHSSQGQDIVGEVRCIVEALNEEAQEQKDAAVSFTKEMQTRYDKLATDRIVVKKDSTSDLLRLSSKVTERVTDVLQSQLLRLDDYIQEFNREFSAEPQKLAKYKIDLIQHLKRRLGSNMASLCGGDVCSQVEAVSTAILERYLDLVQDEDVAKEMRQSLCKDYAPDFDMELENKSSDFHANLSFQCSSYLKMAMIGVTSTAVLLAVPSLILDVAVPSLILDVAVPSLILDVAVPSLILDVAVPSLILDVAVPSLILDVAEPLLIVKYEVSVPTALVTTGFATSLLKYGYDYATWTEKAKEEAFKTQFVSYMTEKLKPEIAQTSGHIAEKSRLALKTTPEKLDMITTRYAHTLRANIAQLERDIQRLKKIIAKSQNLKNTALALQKDLKAFQDKFILV